MSRRLGAIAARGALLSLSVLATLAVGEVAVRRFLPEAPPLRFRQVHLGVQQTVAEPLRQGVRKPIPFDEVFEADPELFWRLAPDVRLSDDHWPLFGVVSNGQRLREDHEIPPRRRPGELRILFVGDSCAFGWLLPHTETVADRTERGLRALLPDRTVEVVNAGVPAYSLFQGWRFLETGGMEYEPDLVVLHFAWNGNGSVVWDGRSDMEHYAHSQATRPSGPLRHLRLYRMLLRALRPAPPLGAGPQARPRLRPGEYRDLLAKVRDTTRRAGSDLLLLVGAGRPNLGDAPERAPFQKEGQYFGERVAREGDGGAGVWDAVPLVRELARTRPVSDLFFDDAHATAVVNRAIAAALVEHLEPWLRARGALDGRSP